MNASLDDKRGAVPQSCQPEPLPASAPRQPPMFDLIELLFFAYRDFVADADRLLESLDFGRAHHRVLHFVHRQPGLTIAELLDILKITKQSLNRVMKELQEAGFVEARPGLLDRRQRLLFPTAAGAQLAQQLADVQTRRFARALQGLGDDGKARATAFLFAMIDPSERGKVADLLARTTVPREPDA